MLTRGTEKAIPLAYLYPEFATQSLESREAYVGYIITRQQEIHDESMARSSLGSTSATRRARLCSRYWTENTL